MPKEMCKRKNCHNNVNNVDKNLHNNRWHYLLWHYFQMFKRVSVGFLVHKINLWFSSVWWFQLVLLPPSSTKVWTISSVGSTSNENCPQGDLCQRSAASFKARNGCVSCEYQEIIHRFNRFLFHFREGLSPNIKSCLPAREAVKR